jgi:hypothetical protein
MTAYEMASKMIKKPRPDAVARLEKAQADARKQKRMVKEALNAIRLNKPYKRNEDLPISKDWK